MTREETKKIIYVLTSMFPNWKLDDPTQTVDAWHFALADFDYNDMAIAVKTYISTSGSAFAPSASQLIAMCRKSNDLAIPDEIEAWNHVRTALGRSTYNSQSEWEKLTEYEKKAVGSPTQLYIWATDDNFNESVISSQFQKNYRTVVERAKDMAALPTEAKMKLAQLQEQMLIGVTAD